jgi:integrating conjugative element membrane protein (TIGR03747 family)
MIQVRWLLLENNLATSSHASIASGTVGHAFTWPLKLTFGIVLIVFLMGFASICSAWLAKHSGLTNAEDALANATQTFEQSAKFIEAIDSPLITKLAQTLADGFYGVYFKVPQLDVALRDTNADANAAHSLYQTGIIRPYRTELLVAMQAIQTLAVRLALLIVALPIVLCVYLVAFVEGLINREYRKLGSGRESASLYHRAKFFLLMYSVLIVCLFLLWPSKIWPLVFLVLLLTGIFLLARLQWKFYKKYL